MPELPPTPTLLPGRKLPGKLMVVEAVYFVLPDRAPFSVETRSIRWLGSASDFVAAEGVEIGNEWIPLVQLVKLPLKFEIGTFIVESLVGKDVQKVPTIEERDLLVSSTIEVRLGENEEEYLLVYPGCSERITTSRGIVSLRCSTNMVARCNIYVFPK